MSKVCHLIKGERKQYSKSCSTHPCVLKFLRIENFHTKAHFYSAQSQSQNEKIITSFMLTDSPNSTLLLMDCTSRAVRSYHRNAGSMLTRPIVLVVLNPTWQNLQQPEVPKPPRCSVRSPRPFLSVSFLLPWRSFQS
mmetsp:Transcript_32864/g.79983  ORF Transcript_32864/g.79983 Transcript_32864/m.79983 type:complete len:137 (+) Transcript_32864:156-566(+)